MGACFFFIIVYTSSIVSFLSRFCLIIQFKEKNLKAQVFGKVS